MRFFHIAREVIQDRRQVHPTPADDLQVREVCLPHLVDGRGLVFEFASSLDDDDLLVERGIMDRSSGRNKVSSVTFIR